MPINIPEDLPARHVLESENIFVMTQSRASRQDIRPLEIAIVNLMPTKIATETQLLRLLGNSPLQVNISLIHAGQHVSRNTAPQHLDRFYKTFDQVEQQSFDGMIITGAPVETLDFEQVDYWEELQGIMRFAATHVHSSLFICWGAQAGLFHLYGIPKYQLPEKISGIFSHRVCRSTAKIFRGFDDTFNAPHSRHTEIRRADIERVGALEILAESEEAGVLVVATRDKKQIFVTGHFEYDADTLDGEYRRDMAKGMDIVPPSHYYPGGDPELPPRVTWRAHAHLFFSNWLNYCVYQDTPYDLEDLGKA